MDGDGIPDESDACPDGYGENEGWNPNEITDRDGDGCHDFEEDLDDDNDMIPDVDDGCASEIGWISNTDNDYDRDGCADSTEDIEYLKNKLLSSLRIPKAFLGFDENVGGKATLAAEDVRFARTIERIQRIIISELTKIAVVHLYSQGYTDEDLVNFELELASPSTMYEQEKIELLGQKVSLARDMISDKILPYEWIYNNVFNFSDDEKVQIETQIIDDQKQKFRHSQIEMEGNDPMASGESIGTPSDMAAVGIGQDDAQTPPDTVAGSIFDPFDDGEDDRPEDEQGGRPQEMNKPFKDSGARGRDPLGKQTKNRRPLALAHYDALKKTMGKKSKNIIQETNQVDELEKEYNEYKEENGEN